MYSYLVYLSFPLIGVVGAMPLMTTLSGSGGSKAQMVVPHGGVRVTVQVTPEGTCHSPMLLGTSGSDSAVLEIFGAHTHEGCLLMPAPMESAG